MRNLKRVLALAMAMVMILGMMVIGSSAASYTDEAAINPDYAVAVDVLTDMGVFKGTGAGFAPKAVLSRAEAAALIYRVITADVKDSKIDLYDYSSFEDVAEGAWYTSYVTYAANGGYIKGDGTGNFLPDAKVTGIQVLAIMLRAMGYGQKGEFEGAAWKDNVLTTADDLGVLDNVAEDDLDKPASRELVAQLLWDAINADTTTYTPAFGYYPSKVSLGEKKFGLTPDTTEDNWGFVYSGWTYATGEGATYFENKHAEYTTKVTECQIAADMFKGKNASKLAVYINGAKMTYTYDIQATDVYTKLGAQGRLTKVYADRIVMVDTLLAKVDTVIPATYDPAGHQIDPAKLVLEVYDGDTADKVTLTSKKNWEYTKGQYLLGWFETDAAGDLFATIHNDAIAAGAEIKGVAESFVGAQTIIHYNDGKHTIDGVDYLDASCLHKNDAGISAAKFTWFKDMYGNVIGSAVIPTMYDWGVIKNIQWFTQAGVYGYAQATMVMMDGSEKSIVVSAIADADDTKTVNGVTVADPTALSYALTGAANLDAGLVSTEIQNNYVEFSGTDLYRIADNGNGTYTLVDIANVAVGGKEDTAVTVTTGAHVMGTGLVDSNTKYLVRTVKDTAAPAADVRSTYAAVTGFNNIGKYNDAIVDWVDTDRDGRAELVYIIGESAVANGAGLFYRANITNSYYVPVIGAASDYYVLNGYVNGELGTIKTESEAIRDAIIAADADTLFDIKLADGFVVDYAMIGNVDTKLHAANKGPYSDLYATSCEGFTVYYDGDALTLKGYISGWNVTEATRVVGTLIEGKEYDSTKYTVHVVFNNVTKNAVEVYVFETVTGGSNTPNYPNNGAWVASVAGFEVNTTTKQVRAIAPLTTDLTTMAAAYQAAGWTVIYNGAVVGTNSTNIATALASGTLLVVENANNANVFTVVAK